MSRERPTLFFSPITGESSIFDLKEAAWKPWRAVFNKGFYSDDINSLIAGMVEEV